MTRALQGRVPLALVGLAALVVAAAVAVTTRGSATDVDAFEQAAGALAGLAVVGMALTARPAWPLSVGLALACFSGHWDALGIPIALDRLLIGTAIVSTLVRERIRSPDALKARPIDCLLALVADLCNRLVADRRHLAVRVGPLRAARPAEPGRVRSVLRRSQGVSRGARPQRAARHARRTRGLSGAHGIVRDGRPRRPRHSRLHLRSEHRDAQRSRPRAIRRGCRQRADAVRLHDRGVPGRGHMARPPLEAGRRDRRRALRARDPAHRHACGLDCRHRGHDPDHARRQGDPPVRDTGGCGGRRRGAAGIRSHPWAAGARRGPRERRHTDLGSRERERRRASHARRPAAPRLRLRQVPGGQPALLPAVPGLPPHRPTAAPQCLPLERRRARADRRAAVAPCRRRRDRRLNRSARPARAAAVEDRPDGLVDLLRDQRALDAAGLRPADALALDLGRIARGEPERRVALART